MSGVHWIQMSIPDGPYTVDGITFTMHRYCGPMFINKDGNDCKRPTKRHWAAFEKWQKLSTEEKEETE